MSWHMHVRGLGQLTWDEPTSQRACVVRLVRCSAWAAVELHLNLGRAALFGFQHIPLQCRYG
jgi:hypothetical protein